MKNKSVFVTGGAGYIGSHVVRQLGERNESIVTLDNLSTGNKEAVLYGDFIEGDLSNTSLIAKILKDYDIDSVMHFAAFTSVAESTEDPLKYYLNNTVNTALLLHECIKANIPYLIFSSTAAVYGSTGSERVKETDPTDPISPYGSSKLVAEDIISEVAETGRLHAATLRYFNVAGADPNLQTGMYPAKRDSLIPAVIDTLMATQENLQIYGTDYPTPDGTAIRDYIHVEDIASAHIAVLDYLRSGGESITLNCGYGHGYSVREIISTAEKISGQTIPIIECDKRSGDACQVIADVSLLKSKLSWNPAYDDISAILNTALGWAKHLKSTR